MEHNFLLNSTHATSLANGGDTMQGAWLGGTDTTTPAAVPGTQAQPGPHGQPTTVLLKADGAVADTAQVGLTHGSSGTFPAAGTWSIFSIYVKKPTSNAAAGFSLNIQNITGGTKSRRLGFKWSGSGLQRETSYDILDGLKNTLQYAIEYWGANDWYRVTVAYMIGEGTDTTVAGDTRNLIVLMHDTDAAALAGKELWLYAPLVETSTFDFKPSNLYTNCGAAEAFFVVPGHLVGKREWTCIWSDTGSGSAWTTALQGRASKYCAWKTVGAAVTHASLSGGIFVAPAYRIEPAAFPIDNGFVYSEYQLVIVGTLPTDTPVSVRLAIPE